MGQIEGAGEGGAMRTDTSMRTQLLLVDEEGGMMPLAA